MRQRFKPNIPSKGTRSSRTSASSTSSSTTKPSNSKEKNASDTNEQQENVPFIPPNSSKSIEESVCEENETIEDTNEVLVVETTTENDTQKPAELNSSKVSNDKKQTTTRRSRIKPVITPAPRRRKNTKEKEIDSTAESTPNAECSAENSPEKDNSQQSDKANTETTTMPTPPETSHNTTIPPAEVSTMVDPQSGTVESTDVDKTQPSGSSLSRRRRATPKICIPPRKKRTTSVSNDSGDKSEVQLETTQQTADEEEVEKEIPEAATSGKPSKRQKVQEDVVEEDIGVIEVTIQSGEQQESTAAVNDEEQDNLEEEQSQIQKKSQVKGRKKRVPIRKPKEMLDPSKMTLQDLIYFNPKENFMKSSTDAKHKRSEQQKQKAGQSTVDAMEVDGSNTENQSNNQQTIDRTEGGEESTVNCAPQVKIAADGSIIVDEESLLIRSPTHSTLEDTDIVYEDANAVNYDFYGKGVKRTRWSMPETLKFYKALSQVGTDFQLMVPLFPMRTRKELKAKFKREEKVNHHLIDKVLVHHTPISLEMFLKAEDDSKNTKKKGKKQSDLNEKETEDNSKNPKRKTRKQKTDAKEKDDDDGTELTVDNDS